MGTVFFKSRIIRRNFNVRHTTLFVIELSRLGVLRFLSIDGAVSLRKDELISDEFVLCSWFCEWSYCILSISFVE